MQNGAKMEAQRHPKGDVFYGFSDASGNIHLFASEPRVSRDCSRKCHTFSSRPPGRRHREILEGLVRRLQQTKGSYWAEVQSPLDQ